MEVLIKIAIVLMLVAGAIWGIHVYSPKLVEMIQQHHCSNTEFMAYIWFILCCVGIFVFLWINLALFYVTILGISIVTGWSVGTP